MRYGSSWWGSNTLHYQFTVPDDEYTVTLKFAEISSSVGSGGRVFTIALEGATVATNVDVYNLAGGRYAAYDRTFTTTVSDGILNIDLTSSAGYPMVSAIEVTTSIPTPVAAFSGTPTEGSSPLSVAFTDESTNIPTSWAWDFNNDGTTDSTEKNPTHVYTADGTYTVRLTATNAGGSNTVTRTNYISVGPHAPVAAFSATPTSGYAPLSVAFTDESTNTPTTWAWDFNNDGTTDSTDKNPSHQYTAVGTYSVSLTAANAGGSDTVTRTNYITVTVPVPVITSISPNHGDVEGGTTVTITGTGLTGATSVMFGTNAGSSVNVVSDTTITVTSPAADTGVSSVYVTVTTPGGTATSADQYSYYTIKRFFTNSTSLSFNTPARVTMEYLVVGGGGGGGGSGGGGGGAGGYLANSMSLSSAYSWTVVVGSGGAGGSASSRGTTGGYSRLRRGSSNIAYAYGGGGGAYYGSDDGRNGGSGGGASGSGTPGDGTSGQGNDGGDGYRYDEPGPGTNWRYWAGGGGGIGAMGGDATSVKGGNGGTGTSSTILGPSLTFSAGGGGGAYTGTAGTGGSTVGGDGGVGSASGSDATYHGSGGGGGGYSTSGGGAGGDGYDGIVIVKYQYY
jgi:PKD repeat protein